MAIDADGSYATYNGTAWAAPITLPDGGSEPLGLDCVSVTNCLATFAFGVYRFTASGWVNLNSSLTIPTAVGCGSASFCVAVDQYGDAQFVRPTSLSKPKLIDPQHGFTNAISCPSSTFCAAVDFFGWATTFDGSSWSAPRKITTGSLDAVACTDPSFCIATDSSGGAWSYNGVKWARSPVHDGNALGTVSCPSSTFCIALDQRGRFLRYSGSAWTSPVAIDSVTKAPVSLSCVSATFCGAVDGKGQYLTYDGTSWSTPSLPNSQPIGTLSCSAPTSCVARTNKSNRMLVLSGTTWTLTPIAYSGGGTVSLACVSDTFCESLGSYGQVSTWDGTQWSDPEYVADVDDFSTSISCPTTTYCAFVGWSGRVFATVVS